MRKKLKIIRAGRSMQNIVARLEYENISGNYESDAVNTFCVAGTRLFSEIRPGITAKMGMS